MPDRTPEQEQLIELTADLLAAHVANNPVTQAELPALIRSVHGALAGLGTARAVETAPTPAVPLKKSVTDSHIACLECGQSFRMLKRHLASEHGMTPQAYRARSGLSPDYPITAPGYSRTRQKLARDIGLGRSADGEAGRGRGKGKKAA